MSFAIADSKAIKHYPKIPIPKSVIDKYKQTVSTSLSYAYTSRSFFTIVDFPNSNTNTESKKSDLKMFAKITNDNDEEQICLAGAELMWNNKLRLKALSDGVENFLPRILYLVRPETAYIAALHYIAKEVGGVEGYLDQRKFIFQNPGIRNFLPKFWAKVQEITWSGGFSPRISSNDRALILLALTEAFHYTITTGSGRNDEAVLVPHLELSILAKACIHIPSITFPNSDPTILGLKDINEMQKRANLPGIPSDMSSHITCHICSNTFDTPEETRKHRAEKHDTNDDAVTCETCGLSFKTAQGYHIHAYTFCKMGPLSQSKCPTCNHPGPRCLCQIHWQRTYAIAASFYEGTHSRGHWLTLSKQHPSILMAANAFLGIPLVPSEPTEWIDLSPTNIDPSQWDPKEIEIPIKCASATETALSINGKAYPISTLWSNITTTLEIDLQILAYPYHQITDTPSSTRRNSARRNIFLEGKTTGIKADRNATVEEYNNVSSNLADLKRRQKRMSSSEKRHLNASMKITPDDISEKINQLAETKESLEQVLFPDDMEFNSEEEEDIISNHQQEDNSDQSDVKSQSEDESDTEDGKFKKNKKSAEDLHNEALRDAFRNSNKKKSVKTKNEAKNSKSKTADDSNNTYYCKNESHQNEKPPYRIFRSRETKIAHLVREHKCPHYKDPIPCHFYFEMDEELGTHLLAKHKTPDIQDTCEICNAKVDKVHLDQHRSIVHSQCESCKAWFKDIPQLQQHYADGGRACLDPSPKPSPKPAPILINPPNDTTLASLPKMEGGHEGLLTEAFGILLDSPLIRHDPKAAEKANRAKELIAKYSFAEKHIATINKNPWVAQSQTTLFLTPPSFVHGPNAKERSMDKALEHAKVTDLSPFVARHFDNFLLADALNLTITQYTKQYYLTETSAVYMFVQHLSQANQDTLRATYKRHAHELTYIEILSCIQKKYYNFDLRSLRDGVSTLKRGHNEHMLEFYNRIYKLATLAALNFQPHEKAAWVEQKTREIFYKGLDTSLKLEIDAIESKDGTIMTSSQLLETYICRQNLKASPLNLDDTLLNVARVKEHKPVTTRRKKVNMVTSYGEVNVNNPAANSPATPPRKTLLTSETSAPTKPPPQRTTSNMPSQPRKSSPVTSRNKPSTNGPPSNPSRPLPYRETARQRLARPPSPITNRRRFSDSQDRQKRQNHNTSTPRPMSKPIKDSTRELMKKLHLTRDTIDRVGVHCFRCGAGRLDMGNAKFHSMNNCPLPPWAGEPHHCNEKIKLLHHPGQCPLKSKRVSKIKIED